MLEFSAIFEGLIVIGIGVVKISVCLTPLRIAEQKDSGIIVVPVYLCPCHASRTIDASFSAL